MLFFKIISIVFSLTIVFIVIMNILNMIKPIRNWFDITYKFWYKVELVIIAILVVIGSILATDSCITHLVL